VKVFIDTSAILAVLNANDQYHPAAKKAWGEILEQNSRLVCNNYILIEIFSILQNRFGMEAVRLFQSQILPILDVVWVSQQLLQQAMSAFMAANRRNLSLVDCASFETTRQAGISTVFSFDPHFQEQGFIVIPLSSS